MHERARHPETLRLLALNIKSIFSLTLYITNVLFIYERTQVSINAFYTVTRFVYDLMCFVTYVEIFVASIFINFFFLCRKLFCSYNMKWILY
jgi:H+/Cl- antiporter ClcA